MKVKLSNFNVMTVAVLAGLTSMNCAAEGETDLEINSTMTQQDQDAVKNLRPEQIRKLNKSLQQAMSLYYDQSYQLAYPILEEIAIQVETLDVTYWLGLSAYHIGKTDKAIEKFNQILQQKPDLNQVKIDLAMAYIQKREFELAKQRLEEVLATNPPAAQAKKIEELIAKLTVKDSNMFASIRGSYGLMSDSNISAQPDDSRIIQDNNFGNTLTIIPNKISGWAKILNLGGNFIYDFGEKNGFYSESKLSYYQQKYAVSDYKAFNYSQLNISTGVGMVSDKWVAKMPVGWYQKRLNDFNKLSTGVYLAPEVKYRWQDKKDLFAGLTYEDESFEASLNGQDNETIKLSLGGQFNFSATDKPKIMTTQLEYSTKDATQTFFSYEEAGLSVSYLHKFSEVDLYLKLGAYQREYDGFIQVLSNKIRDDERVSFNMIINKNFSKSLYSSFSLGYLQNTSNTPIYEYDKLTVGFNIGTSFDLINNR